MFELFKVLTIAAGLGTSLVGAMNPANYQVFVPPQEVVVVAPKPPPPVKKKVVVVPKPPPVECVVAGCGNQLCVKKGDDSTGVSVCLWQSSYECYKTAKCEAQASGSCGWTSTSTLNQCLATAQ